MARRHSGLQGPFAANAIVIVKESRHTYVRIILFAKSFSSMVSPVHRFDFFGFVFAERLGPWNGRGL